LPDSPVAVLSGDGGFMFTAQELMSAAELQLPLPIVVWENNGYKQIEDDMRSRGIPPVGVNGINPDFVELAEACGCHGRYPTTTQAFGEAFPEAMRADRRTVILVREGGDWLA